MNLKLVYKNKIECMKCTYEELEKIYELMCKHSSFAKEDQFYDINNFNLEIELKYKLENTKLEFKVTQEKYKLEMQAQQEKDKLEMQAQQEKDKLEMQAQQEKDKLEMQLKQLEIQVKQQTDKRHDIINMFKENILTFEQFQKCLSVL